MTSNDLVQRGMRPNWTLAAQTVKDRSYVVVVDPASPDPVQHIVASGAGHSPPFNYLFSVLRPGMTVLDLGAHVGTFSLPASALGCKVIAVDGSLRNVEQLRQSARENAFTDLQVIHAAVSDQPGELLFLEEYCYGYVVGTERAEEANVSRVRAVTIDSLLQELGVGHVDVVKMDIQGAEIAAFRGMSRLARQEPAPLIVYESCPFILETLHETNRSLLETVEALGYQSFLIDRGVLRRYRPTDPLLLGVADFAAFKPAARAAGMAGGLPLAPPPTDPVLIDQVVDESFYLYDPPHQQFLQRALAELDRPAVLADPRVQVVLADIAVFQGIERGDAARTPARIMLDGRLQAWNDYFELHPPPHTSKAAGGLAFLGRTLRRIRRLGHAQAAGSAYLTSVNQALAMTLERTAALSQTVSALHAEVAELRARLDEHSPGEGASSAASREKPDAGSGE